MQELVFIQNDQVVTDSLMVAETFEKTHDKVLRDIRELDCSQEFSLSNFGESTYTNSRGRQYDKYFISQDGFSFLVMGYTGKKAATFKERYISEFNRMKNELANQTLPSYQIDDPIRRAERWIIERKEFEALEEQRKIDEPFTTFGKAVSNSKATVNVGAFAKMVYDEHGIKIGRNRLFAWLRDRGYLIRSGREKNVPKQQYIEQGIFDTSVTVVNHNTKGDKEHVTTLITGKGQVKLTEKLLSEMGVTT